MMKEKIKLTNGLVIPAIGFGTYNPDCKEEDEQVAIIRQAIECGYRYFDTASRYGTERALGRAIRESGIDRSEFIVATKVWIDEMGQEETRNAFFRSMERADIGYFDYYLIHWPRREENDTDWKARDLETYRAMEQLVRQGYISGIGLSNFLPHHLDSILCECEIRPVMDQLELHPGYLQMTANSYCRKNDILVQAWSPLGRGRVLAHPYIVSRAEKYQKSPAQICLRFLLQKSIMPIVKASGRERMIQNLDVFDFTLNDEEMSIIGCMPQTGWSGEHPDFAIPKAKSHPGDLSQ